MCVVRIPNMNSQTYTHTRNHQIMYLLIVCDTVQYNTTHLYLDASNFCEATVYLSKRLSLLTISVHPPGCLRKEWTQCGIRSNCHLKTVINLSMLSSTGLLTHNYGTEIFHFVKVQNLFTVFTVLNCSFYPAIYVKVRNLLHSEILSTKTRYSLYGKHPLK